MTILMKILQYSLEELQINTVRFDEEEFLQLGSLPNLKVFNCMFPEDYVFSDSEDEDIEETIQAIVSKSLPHLSINEKSLLLDFLILNQG